MNRNDYMLYCLTVVAIVFVVGVILFFTGVIQ